MSGTPVIKEETRSDVLVGYNLTVILSAFKPGTPVIREETRSEDYNLNSKFVFPDTWNTYRQ